MLIALAFAKEQTISFTMRFKPFRAYRFGRLLPTGISAIVVEDGSIQTFPADCPILKLFKPFHLGLFHPSVLVLRL
jgi:hypothetical protein